MLDTEYGTPAEPEVAQRDTRSGTNLRWADTLTVLALLVAGFVARRNVLPHDGLFGDDAWQAFGAANGSLRDFMTVGFSAPGFTGVLMLWHRLAGTPEAMADLAFAAGVMTPAVLYVALRRFGMAWSVSVLIGAAVAAGEIQRHLLRASEVVRDRRADRGRDRGGGATPDRCAVRVAGGRTVDRRIVRRRILQSVRVDRRRCRWCDARRSSRTRIV